MSLIHRFCAVLFGMALALVTACNPAPLSVVASDFSISGVKGTSSTATTAPSAPTATTVTPGNNSVQNVTINLTGTEACTSLVAKVQLDEGVKISPDPSVARDYSSPVTFTVTEFYGDKITYSLTVKGKACATTTKTTTNKYNNLDSTSLLQIAANTAPSTTAIPARSPTQVEIDAPDNAMGYKNNVNALSLCGSNRWRLPTLTELQTIRLPGATTQIDMDWFAATNFNGYYATSTQFGTQVKRSSVIQFYEKGTATVDKLLRDGTVWHPTLGAVALREHLVRLVRSAF